MLMASKVLFIAAMGGLATVPLLPTEWLQLGVAGISLSILFWITTRTHPAMIDRLSASHERNIDALVAIAREDNSRVVERLDDLNETVRENGKEQLSLLRQHIDRK
jgi:hypothetical protein